MGIETTVHLNFRGNAREALDFYATAFDGQAVAVTYEQASSAQNMAEADLVLWGEVRASNGVHVMAYDVPGALSYDQGERSFFVSLRGASMEEIAAAWNGLLPGATVVQHLAPSGWAPLYGMLTDRFGVTWVLDVAAGNHQQ
ncbi:MAG: VOC family protein [Thermomicrobiales bacterium]